MAEKKDLETPAPPLQDTSGTSDLLGGEPAQPLSKNALKKLAKNKDKAPKKKEDKSTLDHATDAPSKKKAIKKNRGTRIHQYNAQGREERSTLSAHVGRLSPICS